MASFTTRGARWSRCRGRTARAASSTSERFREDRPRKRSDVDDAALAVLPLQRLQRAPLVVKLAIVIVLHDHGVSPPCPLQQGQPPLQRQNRSGWKLV